MINVLLADDHHLVRQGIRLLLSEAKDITVNGEAANGHEALNMLASKLPVDVLLADVLMPDMSGLELAEQIQRNYPNIAVVLLTVCEDDKCLHYAFNAGISGYLLKTTDQDELLFAIRQAARKKKYVCADLADSLMTNVATNFPQHERELAANISFGGRELDVLRLMAEGFSNKEIADQLFTSKRTVEGHRQAMFNKTETKNAAQLIRFAMRAGIIN